MTQPCVTTLSYRALLLTQGWSLSAASWVSSHEGKVVQDVHQNPWSPELMVKACVVNI